MKFLLLSLAAAGLCLQLPVLAEAEDGAKTENVEKSPTAYPNLKNRKPSPGNVTRYIDPEKGDDKADGLSSKTAWRSMQPANQLLLAAGDKLTIAPGKHEYSLCAGGSGSEKAKILIQFLPGKHIFEHGKLETQKLDISNTNDRPQQDKAIAMDFRKLKNAVIEGKGAEILMEGKTIYMLADHCDKLTLSDLSFDYLHPTVCEFKVEAVNGADMDISIAPEYGYELQSGRLIWKGPGWSFPLGGFCKVFNPKEGTFGGGKFSANNTEISELGKGKLRIHYKEGKPSMKAGQMLQNRDTTRDCVGFLQKNSKNISWKNCRIYSIHGMGVVSQFSENLSFRGLKVGPRKGSARSNATWADILHFSGCKGKISVKDCLLSSSHDDAINIHGTHLRIVEKVSPKQLKLQFMHKQTFGIDAFHKGDTVDFIRWDSLKPFGTNKVAKAKKLDDKQILLTMEKELPNDIHPNDVLENVTWTPTVNISNCTVRNVPTRGFLITTRKPVTVEKCRFIRTGNSGILLEDDASGWYESGMVRDMTIKNNVFEECGEPAIFLNPQVKKNEGPVHSNIRISGNSFTLSGGMAVRSHHSSGVQLKGNRFMKDGKSISEQDCVQIQL